MDSNQRNGLIAYLMLELTESSPKRQPSKDEQLEQGAPKKRKQVSDYLKLRKEKSCYFNLLQELALQEHAKYRRFMRMNEDSFQKLLSMVRPYITKQNTPMREPISAEERLALTLRCLATG